jgi:hypothetical protein
MTRLNKPGFTGIVVSILALSLYRGLLHGKLQYSNYWGGAVFAPQF